MLATRASTRNVQRIARSFATVVESAGVKVAAADHQQPTSSVTLLVKAGSRYEPKPGVAHALKNFAFKSTASRSAIGTVRESELYGGQLSSSLTREHLALTAEFLRGDEAYFVDVLTSFVTSAKFTRHEFEEYVAPTVEGDSLAAQANPAVRALEAAHTLAFRNGLGSSLFAPAHNSVTSEDVKAYAQSAFSKDNIIVVGTGIDQTTLSNLVEKSFSKLRSSALSSSSSSYFGGETRVDAHGGPQTVFIGFGVAGAPSADLATLASLLSTEASVKWSKGLSPLADKVPEGASVQTVYLPYSDASLLGFLVQGNTAADVKAAGKAAVEALKASTSADAETLKRATAKAKFTVASSADGREGLVASIGSKVFGGSAASLDAALTAFDGVTTSSFSKVASELAKAKPTFVAVGDVQALPYADELGL